MSTKNSHPASGKPHHHHALVKGSAAHLFRHGHIDKAQHNEIVKHAERGMKEARGKKRTGE